MNTGAIDMALHLETEALNACACQPTASAAPMPAQPTAVVQTLAIAGGRTKGGAPEELCLVVRPGDVVCVVGPTGSGKSRLLADIECLAQGDTPTGRMISLNDAPPSDNQRFSAASKLVAQLCQGMSYALDLPAGAFVDLHARSRGIADPSELTAHVLQAANDLCGEPFGASDPVCALSGGQSRALMIADVALISASPVVLVDELENAGIDRRRALEVLVQGGKIVFVATHDPLLMLMGHRRLVMTDGAVAQVLERTPQEEALLRELEVYDRALDALREGLRHGRCNCDGAQRFPWGGESRD